MGTSTQYITQETSTLPSYVAPQYTGLLRAAEGLTLGNLSGYQTFQDKEGNAIVPIAGFTNEQRRLQQQISNLQTPGEFNNASFLARTAGLGSLAAANYAPGQFTPQQVQAQQYSAPQISAARTNYNPQLQTFQIGAPESYNAPGTSQRYMSPYMQDVLDVQKREAVRDARQTQLAQDLGAARQGTYGGSRQLLASLGRERQLGQRLGDIQATGLQAAFQNAQQQFNTEQQARQAAQQANLQAALGVQQLGTTTGLQTALANLSSEQQANVQNQAAILQTQGLNADQALRAALANQQAGLEAQRLGEQSRQFGAQQELAALGQAGQMGQTLTNIGQGRQNADLARLGFQQSTAAQEQALQDAVLAYRNQEFINEREYPFQLLQQYNSILRGVPVSPNTMTTTQAPKPGIGQQILGGGLGLAGAAKVFGGI